MYIFLFYRSSLKRASEYGRYIFRSQVLRVGNVHCTTRRNPRETQLRASVPLRSQVAQNICNGHSSYLLNGFMQQIFHIAANQSSIDTAVRVQFVFCFEFVYQLQSRRVSVCCIFELYTNIFIIKPLVIYDLFVLISGFSFTTAIVNTILPIQ